MNFVNSFDDFYLHFKIIHLQNLQIIEYAKRNLYIYIYIYSSWKK